MVRCFPGGEICVCHAVSKDVLNLEAPLYNTAWLRLCIATFLSGKIYDGEIRVSAQPDEKVAMHTLLQHVIYT